MQKADKSNLWHYNPKLREYAANNRRNMTKAEACLWKYVLGGRRLMGYQFRRQRPVGPYIADFLCKELLLIIEVDGWSHNFEEVAQKDTARESALNQMGVVVLRFSDDEVLNDIGNVERTLIDYIKNYKG